MSTKTDTCTATPLLANEMPAWNDDALCTDDRSGLLVCECSGLEDAPVPQMHTRLIICTAVNHIALSANWSQHLSQKCSQQGKAKIIYVRIATNVKDWQNRNADIPRGARSLFSCAPNCAGWNAAGYVDLIPRTLSLFISDWEFTGTNSDVGMATVVCTTTTKHTQHSAAAPAAAASSPPQHCTDVMCLHHNNKAHSTLGSSTSSSSI